MPNHVKGDRGTAQRLKHVPQRTCVICRQRDAKRQLTRVVRQPDGNVVVDPTGKMNGRGAYVCDSSGCWERAAEGQGLARALKTELGPETLARLRQAAAEHLVDSHRE